MNAKHVENKKARNNQPFVVVSHTEAERDIFSIAAEIMNAKYGWDLNDLPACLEFGGGAAKIITHWVPMEDQEDVEIFMYAWNKTAAELA